MKQTALLVGVNRYEDDAIVNLAYAEQDARELYAFLKRTALYDEVRHLPAFEADEDRILNAAARLIEPLEPGDLFLFFFAGHGVQFRGRHLLLCPQVRFHRLEFGHHTVPVDLLKQETARSGVSRVFVLDACRGNLLATREGPAQGFRGAARPARYCLRARAQGRPALDSLLLRRGPPGAGIAASRTRVVQPRLARGIRARGGRGRRAQAGRPPRAGLARAHVPFGSRPRPAFA